MILHQLQLRCIPTQIYLAHDLLKRRYNNL